VMQDISTPKDDTKFTRDADMNPILYLPNTNRDVFVSLQVEVSGIVEFYACWI